MKLSVIIVNYNVEFFLEQCLRSVELAMQNVDGDVWVVDNNSVDGSVPMVREKFPEVKLIANKDNPGFSKANNQAIRQSDAEYVLLLNPDTLVEEDTFSQVVDFMDQHTDAGGLGVKMVDGRGRFLPESKRGIPTPIVSFYKIIGLTRLFPKSSTFARYYLGHLPENETHEIEILSGAFMLMRKSTLDEVGLLDETFFMYGEDIDLSYRILLGGKKNYYYPHTRIIHYKGESTKRGSLNYVLVFYRAMIIFAEKHFSSKQAKVLSIAINLGIYFRAGLAIFTRLLRRLALPLVEGMAVFGGLIGLQHLYELWKGATFQEGFILPALAIMAATWVIVLALSGSYRNKIKRSKLIKSLGLASVFSLIIYAFLPETMRFSRVVIGSGIAWGMIAIPLVRFFGSKYFPALVPSLASATRNIGLVGSEEEIQRVHRMLERTAIKVAEVHYIGVKENQGGHYVGDLSALEEIARLYNLDDLIFCSANIPTAQIISLMDKFKGKRVDFKIAPPEGKYIIGSQDVALSGDMLLQDVNSLAIDENKFKKRTLDSAVALVLLMFSPLLIWFVREKSGFFNNIKEVILGNRSWVGYYPSEFNNELPASLSGVLGIAGLQQSPLSSEAKRKLNVTYAKDYSASRDLKTILSHFRYLGYQPNKAG